jgi:hypothetical protein
MMGRVILVGNSVELLQHEYGSYIDSFDTIVRFGKGIPTDENFEQIGKKTDIWITGFLRQRHYHRFENAKILFNRCRIHMNTEPSTPKFTQPHEVMFTDKEILEIFDLVGATNDKALGDRPSAGFLGILYFLNKCEYESIEIIGFDFFSKKLPFSTGADYPASWHLPVNSKDRSPHNPNEKQIVKELADRGKIKWKVLSDLKEEFLDFS